MSIRNTLRQIRRHYNAWKKDLSRFYPLKAQSILAGKHELPMSHAERLLIATKNGLYLATKKHLFKIFNGSFYGLSHHRGWWYAFQSFSTTGRIIRFRLRGWAVCEPEVVLKGLSPGCHQIDWINGRLAVMDTYNNRVAFFALDPKSQRLKFDQELFPVGVLRQGRDSENYVHMNSICQIYNSIYVLFHNCFHKTMCYSDIIQINMDTWEMVQGIKTKAENGHNIMPFGTDLLHCDSTNGNLKLGDETVFHTEQFVRGLARTSEFIFLGESEYGERSKRDEMQGGLVILTNDFAKVRRIPIPGMVQEIRVDGADDLGMSVYARSQLDLL